MSSLESLIRRYPDASVIGVRQELNELDFADQKTKQQMTLIEGAAIGVVWVGQGELVLTRRTKPHKGWALPGGKVEAGESFDGAFIREIEEETGLKATINRLLLVEQKVFISPTGEELPIALAVFEASAIDQRIIDTDDAAVEGIVAQLFDTAALPTEMILQDRGKIDLALRR